ncbi:MAG: hypothetical protein PHH04_02965 [Thomasclavelia sp.]|jgi:hypothetical protein|nr:hypothetical protein [Thomasclavelia sp.]
MIKCSKCDHEFSDFKFAYKFKQRCPNCGTVMEIHMPSGSGFIPVVLAFVAAVTITLWGNFGFLTGLAFFVVFYWPIDIIMNAIFIYTGKYEMTSIKDKY